MLKPSDRFNLILTCSCELLRFSFLILVSEPIKIIVMGGPIEENKKKRKDKNSDPLKEIGKTEADTNKVDYDEKTIKDQQNKK